MQAGVEGVGLGFRREIASSILSLEPGKLAFVELAPENWMGIGGALGKILKEVSEKYPILCHGLSLSIGSPEPLDWDFIKELKQFFKEVQPVLYSEHLSYCQCDNAHLYDLLPLSFCKESVAHVSKRIAQVQDYLERTIAIENVSYYSAVSPKMQEVEFLSEVLEKSGCHLLLDVNNVFVNSFNHGYDPKEFIEKLPLNKVAYIHMAGHEKRSDDLIIDTHGQPIIDPVYDLFEWTIQKISAVPVLLERDFNFCDFDQIMNEVRSLQQITQKHWVCHELSV